MKPLERIELFDSLFYICLGIALVGLIFAVFFFFYFNIPSVYALMSGRTRKKALEKMQERSAEGKSIRSKPETGSVRKAAPLPGESGGLSGSLTGGLSGGLAYDPPAPQRLAAEDGEETMPLGEAAATSVLQPDKPDTTLLKAPGPKSEAGATAMLSRPAPEKPAAPKPSIAEQYNFRIREQVLLIHTQESI